MGYASAQDIVWYEFRHFCKIIEKKNGKFWICTDSAHGKSNAGGHVQNLTLIHSSSFCNEQVTFS